MTFLSMSLKAYLSYVATSFLAGVAIGAGMMYIVVASEQEKDTKKLIEKCNEIESKEVVYDTKQAL